jgi:multidrug efflux pump subunit AcrA (membrane-fusion protein)
MIKLRKINFIPVLIITLVVISCAEKKVKKEVKPQVIPVEAAKIELRDLQEMLEYVGNVKAKDEAIIYPKVSGKIIEKVREEGAEVKKGDVIAYIDRDEVGLKFEKAPVDTPLTGTVARVFVDLGANVTNTSPVALVASMDTMKIDLDIPEKYLAKISLGQAASISVDAYPGKIHSGRITKISPFVDLGTRSVPIEITVDNPRHSLISGMFARVKLAIQEQKKTAVVLKEAIMGRDPDCYVFVVQDNKAVLKKVVLGIRQGPYYQIKEGLKEGDWVVVMGQQRLRDGMQVSVEEENR